MTSLADFLVADDSQFSFSAMFTPPKRGALRRMKLQELIFKMQQIEEQAALTLDEYPQGHTVEREAIAKDVESKLRVVESDAEPVRVAVLPQRSTSAEK